MMILIITVERPAPDNLTSQSWSFQLLDVSNRFELRMTKYAEWERKTPRHKWAIKKNKFYTTHDRRYSTMDVADVPLPDDVKVEVYEKFMDEMNTVKIVKEW